MAKMKSGTCKCIRRGVRICKRGRKVRITGSCKRRRRSKR